MAVTLCYIFSATPKLPQLCYPKSSNDLSKLKYRSSRVAYNTQAVFFKEGEKTKSSEPVSVPNVSNTTSKSVSFDGQLNKSASNTPLKSVSLDYSKVKEYSSKLLNDMASRPSFYGQLALAALVGIISIQIVGSIEESLNRIPVIPSILELVGIAYSAYFAWRYVSYPETRNEVENTIKSVASKLNLNK